jgi:hypothetical protein
MTAVLADRRFVCLPGAELDFRRARSREFSKVANLEVARLGSRSGKNRVGASFIVICAMIPSLEAALGIPTIRDRVLQRCASGPLFEQRQQRVR